MLDRWADAFFAEFDRLHPSSIAERAARLLRSDFKRKWTVTELSVIVGAKSRRLTIAFLKDYGLSTKEFQRRLRICEALKRMRSEKIEFIALDIGYKSKKDFYQAFLQLTGMKPIEFRRLSPERALDITESIRLRGDRPRRI